METLELVPRHARRIALPDNTTDFVQHFIVDNIDEIIVASLQALRDDASSPFHLVEMEDIYYGQEMAENHDIWVKERKWIKRTTIGMSDGSHSWSIERPASCEPQDGWSQLHQTTSYVEFHGADLNSLIDHHTLPTTLSQRLHQPLEPFMTLRTTRLSVDKICPTTNTTTTCWIESTCDSGRDCIPYYVSCGMCYTNRSHAVEVWQHHFGWPLHPFCLRLFSVSNLALVFSGFAGGAAPADTLHIANPSLGFRAVNPLVSIGRIIDSPVLLSTDVGGWARMWCARLKMGPPISGAEMFPVPDLQRQSALLDQLIKVADFVQRFHLAPLQLLRLSPAHVCHLVLHGIFTSDLLSENDITQLCRTYDSLANSNKRLALAGFCGLLHVWRPVAVFQQTLECYWPLNKADFERFVAGTTAREMHSIRALLETTPLAKQTPTHSDMLVHIRQNAAFQSKLEHDFQSFQSMTMGLALYQDCI